LGQSKAFEQRPGKKNGWNTSSHKSKWKSLIIFASVFATPTETLFFQPPSLVVSLLFWQISLTTGELFGNWPN